MEALECHIRIGNYLFDFVHNVEIDSSWENLTDTAVIMLPAALRIDNKKLKEAIPPGTEVTISLGYGDNMEERFTGFVARVRPKYPIEIECEDAMWKLKQFQINENASKETLPKYLSRVMPIAVDCFEVALPKFIAHKITGAQLLDQIKQDFGFPSFIRDGKLVVGKQYDAENYKVHKIVIDQAFNCNVKSQDLEYCAKEDIKLKVTAISNMSNGSKIEVEIGDVDGEDRTLNFFDLQEPDLRKIAEKEMDRLRYDGYRGDLTLFGDPLVKHGDVIELVNSQESDKTGRYWVDSVVDNFGLNGYEQVIKLGSRT